MNNVDGRILELSTTLKQLGLVKSQAEFCREIGFMKQNIRKVKLGIAHFSLEHLSAICRVYNVDANYIVGKSVSPFLKTKIVHKQYTKQE
jgi:transcriptional regulator with XRE-family HTH domain